jgi:hypothetical protein
VRPLQTGSRFPDPGEYSTDSWEAVLKPVVARYQKFAESIAFRGDAAFAQPNMYEYLESEGIEYTIRLPANQVLQAKIGHLLKRPVGALCAALLQAFPLPGSELAASASGCGEGGVAPRRVVSARLVHRHELASRVQERRWLLQ